jgi:hypothetical protein
MTKRFADHRNDTEGKDEIILPILEAVKVTKRFKAILMPAEFGPEVDILSSQGVPLRNMWAIERDPKTYKKIKKKGLRVASAALEIKDAINEMLFIDPGPYGLVYLDPFGKPSFEHFESLIALMEGNHIKGTLIYNCCPTARCPAPRQKEFTAMLKDFSEKHDVNLVTAMVLCAAQQTDAKISNIKTDKYLSKTGNKMIKFHTCSCRVG